MAPESIAKRIYSKKSDVWSFAIVGEWVYVFVCVCVCSHLFALNTFLCFVMYLDLCFELLIKLNWEKWTTHTHLHIFCVCLLLICIISVWDCCTMWTSYGQKYDWYCNANQVSIRVVLCCIVLCWGREMSFIHTSLSWFVVNAHNTHTLQRPRIDTRDSSWMSRETCTIDENVLEQRSQSTSCILSLSFSIPSQSQSSQIVFVLICETKTHTLTYWREEKWVSFSFSVLIVVLLDLKHTSNTQIERTLKLFVQCCNNNEINILIQFANFKCFLLCYWIANRIEDVWDRSSQTGKCTFCPL
jgi:hypothetical protein